jgi:hypothetical protein
MGTLYEEAVTYVHQFDLRNPSDNSSSYLHVKNKENYRPCWELIVMVTVLGEIRNYQFGLSNNPILIVQFKA